MEKYRVTGMSCAACQARVEKAVANVPGVENVSVSLLTNSMGVEGSAPSEAVIRAVEDAGYGASPMGAGAFGGMEHVPSKDGVRSAGNHASYLAAEEEALRDTETPKLQKRLLFSVLFLILLMYISMGHSMWNWPLPPYFEHNHLALSLTQMLLSLIVMIINGKFFTSGFKSLFHAAPNMDTLVALGSSVSFGWSVFVFYKMCGLITNGTPNMELMDLYHNELYFESAAMIPALITVGKMLEAMSKGKTTDALKSLMKLAPKTAVIIKDGAETEVLVENVRVGDLFVVRPGENIPVDGIVISGTGAVNESALTGESIPADKAPGDKVSAATTNQSGFLTCEATRVGEDTTFAQIIRMVSDAAATKAPIARVADKVSGIFVPAVIGIALLVVIIWLIAGKDAAFALARGISVLVISCPCALGLATPVAIMVGNGMGAKAGILFKTSEALENAGKIKNVALDKTGTVTTGESVVTEILPAAGVTVEELLVSAFSLEEKSEHPLARAIVTAAKERNLKACEITDFRVLPGNGLCGMSAEGELHGGSRKYIEDFTKISDTDLKKAEALSEEGKTPLYFEKGGEFLGIIAVSDSVKEDSAEGIRQLKNLGIRVIMLTGDNEKTAKAIAEKAGIEEVIAGVSPEGKAEAVSRLQKSGRVAMVGDGINDAPALTTADTGIAIGAGTDVAIDSADIVLVNNSVADVAAAIRLSRKTLKNIHENLFWAFFYNIICIPIAAGVLPWKMNPMIAAAAMSLSSFTVCMNALRLNLYKLRNTKETNTGKNKSGMNKSGMSKSGMNKTERSNPMEKTVKIEGMMCPHCEAAVKKALEELPFVKKAEASHEKKQAVLTLSGDFDEAAVKGAVEGKGYKYTGLE